MTEADRQRGSHADQRKLSSRLGIDGRGLATDFPSRLTEQGPGDQHSGDHASSNPRSCDLRSDFHRRFWLAKSFQRG